MLVRKGNCGTLTRAGVPPRHAGTQLATTDKNASEARGAEGEKRAMQAEAEGSPTDQTERRAHRRMDIRLPVECRKATGDQTLVIRTIAQNVGTGGLYLELDSADFEVGDRLQIELTVPPAEGVSPYQGRARCSAKVLRVTPVEDGRIEGIRRYGVAAQFLDKLRVSY